MLIVAYGSLSFQITALPLSSSRCALSRCRCVFALPLNPKVLSGEHDTRIGPGHDSGTGSVAFDLVGVDLLLMRHSNVATTMNVNGNATMRVKQQANSKVVRMVMTQERPQEIERSVAV